MAEPRYPNPNTVYTINGITRTVYLKNIINNPQIIVGDYTYYDDPDDVYSASCQLFLKLATHLNMREN